ncbi:replication-relaxation family protein [Streptomyces sp. NPDC059755]|uniref:replication-relaxation family protein n=1 Tax=Streptomyces sp. NPDC059755 TaxID=3346934 RepID=UPI0036541F32
MATTEQMHLITAPRVRIEQTRRRLAKFRAEGLVDRITLPQAGRTRVWFATGYGVQVAGEWPELRGRRPPKLVSDPVAARLRVSHTLTVTETGLQFLLDARRREEVCRPWDFLPEVHHPLGGGEAVIPDALLYYQRGSQDGGGAGGSMLRAFLEVDRATMGPERLASKLRGYARLHQYAPTSVGQRRTMHRLRALDAAVRFKARLDLLDAVGSLLFFGGAFLSAVVAESWLWISAVGFVLMSVGYGIKGVRWLRARRRSTA